MNASGWPSNYPLHLADLFFVWSTRPGRDRLLKEAARAGRPLVYPVRK